MKKYVSKVLELSTAHLPNDQFESLNYSKHRYGGNEYGFMIIASEYKLDELKEYKALMPILKYAIENNYSYINFDSDNDICTMFKVYDW